MRLVLDTNVVVSALIWGGSPRQVVALALRPDVALFTSDALQDELRRVLARSRFAASLSSSERLVEKAAYGIVMAAKSVHVSHVPRVVPSDPDDDIVIATAVAADADVIVTGDRDLLSLDPHGTIRILAASPALRFVRKALGMASLHRVPRTH